ncbi:MULTISPECIES: hypothetical protein [unclassified Microcystis]|uniref:hypothetical protein n=1 Tax=unclassified Microcystis TaxID=2643300 RepID=UPI00257C342A|nr:MULTISPECIES: hypothetical protein [unclassified Microcystis]MCA2927954.1 hypothetical protein [Microcystis sp. M020S1]MCA2936021.1 hypothetical protein [Microcystis sp. M015S1]MCA2620597.1 hypothetical protein [Microcystis sp. M099S2]MCA2650825.1 hypothetical protein [Microcystis sp. M065S2]MCA2679187.1 hypothetical protein [Microcystis sp. M043S2]
MVEGAFPLIAAGKAPEKIGGIGALRFGKSSGRFGSLVNRTKTSSLSSLLRSRLYIDFSTPLFYTNY